MVICHSGKSAISANLIADEDDTIFTNRGGRGDINWGRYKANTALNPDIRNVTNKRVMRELFKEHGVPMPKLVTGQEVYEELAPLHDWEHGVRFIGRPDQHSKGRGLWRIATLGDLRTANRGTRKKKRATHFMEYIEAPREYRVHIFKGKSIRISEKAFNDDKSDYTTVKPEHNVKHVRKAAKKAVKAVGLDFGAVDILANDTQCWVLEVNAAPGLGGSMPALYAKTFKRYMEGEW